MKKVILIAVAVLLMGSGCGRDCLKGHTENVHHEAWTQTSFIYMGKTMIPQIIQHPAYDSNEFVCDEYAP
jgi:hypothetical protein